MARKAVAPVLLALFTALGLLFSQAAPAAAASCPNENVPSAELTLDQFDASVFCLINVERAAHHFQKLRPNALLDIAAGDYTNSLMAGRFFSHAGDFAGHDHASDPIQRLRQIGYIRRGREWMVGEDLRWSTPETSMPAYIVQAWMLSPIHRFYLLKPNFRELGVAATRGTPIDPDLPDGVTVAAEFGFRR